MNNAFVGTLAIVDKSITLTDIATEDRGTFRDSLSLVEVWLVLFEDILTYIAFYLYTLE